MKKDQPVLDPIPATVLEQVMDGASLLGLVLLWVFVVRTYPSLPDTIPSHFNLSGEVNDYSGKAVFLLLPALATGIVIVLTIGNRSPHRFNYPVTITNDNAHWHYRNARFMLRWLKLVIVGLFGGITLMIRNTVTGIGVQPGIWLLPSVLILILLPVGVYLVKAFRRG